MKRTSLAVVLAASLAMASGAALAGSCPTVMKAIDAALPTAKLDAAKMSEVQKLRAEGEAHHKAGKHDDSIAALNKAKSILGIK